MQVKFIEKNNKIFDFNNWRLECKKNIPIQKNSFDCGIFLCMYAKYLFI